MAITLWAVRRLVAAVDYFVVDRALIEVREHRLCMLWRVGSLIVRADECSHCVDGVEPHQDHELPATLTISVAAALDSVQRMFFSMSLAPSYLEAAATVATVARAVGDLDALVAISQMAGVSSTACR